MAGSGPGSDTRHLHRRTDGSSDSVTSQLELGPRTASFSADTRSSGLGLPGQEGLCIASLYYSYLCVGMCVSACEGERKECAEGALPKERAWEQFTGSFFAALAQALMSGQARLSMSSLSFAILCSSIRPSTAPSQGNTTRRPPALLDVQHQLPLTC